MKFILLTCSLLFLVSCNDTLRTRGRCLNEDNVMGDCNASTDKLSADVIRKQYIAQVTTSLETDETKLVILEHAKDTDYDQEYTCSFEVLEGKTFKYSIKQNKLLLQDGFSTLVFERTYGASTKELLGSWSMKEEVDNVQFITELIINSLEEIRIRRVCNLR